MTVSETLVTQDLKVSIQPTKGIGSANLYTIAGVNPGNQKNQDQSTDRAISGTGTDDVDHWPTELRRAWADKRRQLMGLGHSEADAEVMAADEIRPKTEQ